MNDIHSANVGEFHVRSTIDKIISFAETKGDEAGRQKDYRMYHYYWQIAEHWKRFKRGRSVSSYQQRSARKKR